jgi:DNA-binding NtrC family response regulator
MADKRKTILIVEDEELVRSMLRDKFEHEGYRVLEAEDGREGQNILEDDHVDLVISDLIMPRQDGLELLMAMRAGWPNIPLIVITAPSNQLYLEVAGRLGASRTFEKPLDLDALGRAARDLLDEPDFAPSKDS